MTDKVTKFLKVLDQKTKERLKKRLIEVKKNPFNNHEDVKKLKGLGNDVYRLRVGKIRVVYQVIENDIEILAVDYRGNIY